VLFSVFCRIGIRPSGPFHSAYVGSVQGRIDLFSIGTGLLAILLLLLYEQKRSEDHKSSTLLIQMSIFRIIRVLRVFRIFFHRTASVAEHLRANKKHLFTTTFFTILVIGCAVYLIEGDTSGGFHNIPLSLYWTFMTFTTVGVLDHAPETLTGKLCYGIIAIAAPIFLTVFPARQSNHRNVSNSTISVESSSSERLLLVFVKCLEPSHERNAHFCRICDTA
jgi:hypothetical protein